MGFSPDRRFSSLRDATEFIFEQHPSGLVIPADAPRYLFRGENGDYPATTGAMSRRASYSLIDGRQLSSADMEYLRQMFPRIHERFSADDYRLDEHHITALLQHYGIPTFVIDFTAHLRHALTFAVMGRSEIGRVAVLPARSYKSTEAIIDLREHPWAERPRRQQAFGVIMPTDTPDLKSSFARAELNVSWYEFPIGKSDRDAFSENYRKLTALDDDPSAGFLRFHLTEYVEAYGKMPPTCADWILERVPIAARCYLARAYEDAQVVVRFRATNLLPAFNESAERLYSRRYWSSDFPDSSWDRMRNWWWPEPGSLTADPRTYHPELQDVHT